MKIKTSELSGAALDWAVVKCELPAGWADDEIVLGDSTDYSTDWSLGGPIIERERISVRTQAIPGFNWVAFIDYGGSTVSGAKARKTGPTLLIAAMRCFVASRLGDEVDVPEELCV